MFRRHSSCSVVLDQTQGTGVILSLIYKVCTFCNLIFISLRFNLSVCLSLSLQIVDGPELWAESTDRSSTLVIAEAKPQHAGRYAVVVKDRRSSAEHTLTISVIGKATTAHALQHLDHEASLQLLDFVIHYHPTQRGLSLRPPVPWSPSYPPTALCCPGPAPVTTAAAPSWVTWSR